MIVVVHRWCYDCRGGVMIVVVIIGGVMIVVVTSVVVIGCRGSIGGVM